MKVLVSVIALALLGFVAQDANAQYASSSLQVFRATSKTIDPDALEAALAAADTCSNHSYASVGPVRTVLGNLRLRLQHRALLLRLNNHQNRLLLNRLRSNPRFF